MKMKRTEIISKGVPDTGNQNTGIKVKICGLTRLEDVTAVNQCRPDYAGFVFAKSRRQVTGEQAEKLRNAMDPKVRSVGVFVNADPEEICRLCEKKVIDLVQLHGDEDAAYLEQLAGRVEVPLIRAVRVQSKEQILKAQEQACDYLLLDTYLPGQYGGGGQTFDAALIPPLYKPWFLAGGLDGENVAEKIQAYHPFGVDVSSSVETDGKKDSDKIQEFVERVRRLTSI